MRRLGTGLSGAYNLLELGRNVDRIAGHFTSVYGGTKYAFTCSYRQLSVLPL